MWIIRNGRYSVNTLIFLSSSPPTITSFVILKQKTWYKWWSILTKKRLELTEVQLLELSRTNPCIWEDCNRLYINCFSHRISVSLKKWSVEFRTLLCFTHLLVKNYFVNVGCVLNICSNLTLFLNTIEQFKPILHITIQKKKIYTKLFFK